MFDFFILHVFVGEIPYICHPTWLRTPPELLSASRIFPRGSRSSGGFVTVVGFQEHFARWAREHPEGATAAGLGTLR